MELKIAICDDEENVCYQLEKIIIEILKQRAVKYQIELFFTGEELCEYMEKRQYDLIFLDIELPNVNGIDIGKYVREMLKNEMVQIAYISAKAEYAIELFDFRPINFLIKPLDVKKVTKVIDKYCIINGQNNYVFNYMKKKQYYKVPMSEIRYFERNNRKVTIHTKNGIDEFYDSMEQVYARVKGNDFLFIHKSIIVNYRFIKKVSYDNVEMADGTVLPISQPRRKEIKEMCMNIRKGEM